MSPQQTWQSILLETIGIDGHTCKVTETEDNQNSKLSSESELSLRSSILDQRRLYFRSMRSAQSLGLVEPIRPRIQIESVENIFDGNILRLVEGMEGVESCKKYQLLEERFREPVERQLLSEYSSLQSKVRSIEKILKKMIAVDAQNKIQAMKQQKLDELEAKRRIELQMKEFKTSIIAAQKQRNQKIKEIEKAVTNVKSVRMKTIKHRKDELKIFLEALVERDMNFDFLHNVLYSNVQETIDFPMPRELQFQNLDDDFLGVLSAWEFANVFARLNCEKDQCITLFNAWSSLHPVLLSLNVLEDKAIIDKNIYLEAFCGRLCELLRKSYEKTMGLDMAEFQLGGLQIPINEFTWKEILKTVLFAKCSKLIGIADVDISTLIKARGFYTSPESADRKALKLARRRILYAYSVRSELQETSCGFQDYFTVRVPSRCRQDSSKNSMKKIYISDKNAFCPFWLLCQIVDLINDDAIQSPNEIEASKLLDFCKSKSFDPTAKIPWEDVVDCAPSIFSWSNFACDKVVHVLHRKASVTEKMVEDFEEDCLPDDDRRDLENKTKTADTTSLDALSVLVKRCWLVVEALSNHSQAATLLNPNLKTGPTSNYYKFAKQPLSLEEIKDHLLGGNYLKATEFYEDMTLLFENILGFHTENSPSRSAALRLQIVFERLFYEMVIACEYPLPCGWSCHACRCSDDVDNSKIALCERCEGVYHVYCLSPPLSSPPRAEWLCPACIEQKSIASAHPLRVFPVQHPTTKDQGEIVAIDQLLDQLVFTVDFGEMREKWDAAKVYDNIIKSSVNQTCFPIDIDFDDYNSVSGLIKAYSGYGGSHYYIHPILAKELSLVADNLLSTDQDYQLFSDTISLLNLDPKTFTSEQWLLIIRSILNVSFEQLAHGSNLRIHEEVEKSVNNIRQLVNEQRLLEKGHRQDELATTTTVRDSLQIGVSSPANEAFKKGVEDAISVKEIIQDIADQLDLMDLDTEPQDIREELGDFNLQLIPALMKSFGTVTEENEGYDYWLSGFDQKLTSLNGNSQMCQICGHDENFIGSTFVRCLTAQEWVKFYNRHISQLVKEDQLEIIETMRYFPVNCTMEDCEKSLHAVSDSALVAHDYCARIVDVARLNFVFNREMIHISNLAEQLDNVGKATNTFIGSDRNGCKYWFLQNSNAILVKTSVFISNQGSKMMLYVGSEEIEELYRYLDPSNELDDQIRFAIRFTWPTSHGKDTSSKLKLLQNSSSTSSINDTDISESDEDQSHRVQSLPLANRTGKEDILSRVQELNAYNFLNKAGRHSGCRLFPNFDKNQMYSLNVLKVAMLLIETALPIGAIDESDERWGSDFSIAWREYVTSATDSISLMQCQIMLEYGIKTSWLKPTGLKLLSCLPSRIQALRTASTSSLALRVWVLDMTIKYDKIDKKE